MNAKYKPLTVADLILIHVRASGPVTFPSICLYIEEQHSPRLDDYQIAEQLTRLCRQGKVKLYDDGQSWVADLKRANL